MIAQAALLLWPLVAILFYRKLPLPQALAATIIGGYLFLPTQTGWNFPALPTFNKHTIPALSALILTAVALADRRLPGRDDYLQGWLPRHPLVAVLCVIFVLSSVGTVLTNSDPLFYGSRVLRGLPLYDVLSGAQSALLTLLPFLLARRVFALAEGHRVLLSVLAIAGALYALPALYEIRMSPQMSNMVYGFFPHDWKQHFRSGSWRPIVFLNHGLWLAIFFCTAALAAFGLWRVGPDQKKRKFLGLGLLILVTLALSSSLTGLAIAICFLPVVLFGTTRLKMLIAAGFSVLILAYPTLRYADLVPTSRILGVAATVDTVRAGSLAFRFENEDRLLDKAKERPIFGWGGWGRSRIYNEDGDDIAITDGRWVIVFGLGGWVGYLSEFGLLGFAVLSLALQRRRYEPDPVTAVLALVLAANLIDLLPNSGLSPITWLMAGALAGRLELVSSPGRSEHRTAGNIFLADAQLLDRKSKRRFSVVDRNDAASAPEVSATSRFTRFPTRNKGRS